MYSPDVEPAWLHYSTYLLLSLTSRSPDFERVLFDPLTDCEFKEYNLDFTWQQRSFSHMTPLFSQSQSLSQDILGEQTSDEGGVYKRCNDIIVNLFSVTSYFRNF